MRTFASRNDRSATSTQQRRQSGLMTSLRPPLRLPGVRAEPFAGVAASRNLGWIDARAPIEPTPVLLPAPSFLQCKLMMGATDDPVEREADRVAKAIVEMPGTPLPDAAVRPRGAAGVGGTDAAAPPEVHRALASAATPLDSATRAYMEPRFGIDFSHVRVHTDEQAAESARAVHSLAYTVGRDLVFDTGEYAPESTDGRRLLAHELAHVVQQGERSGGPSLQRFDSSEKSQIAPTYKDMLAQVKTLIEAATRPGLLQDETNMDLLVEIAGGSSATRGLGRGLDRALSTKHSLESKTIPSRLFIRYLFTCRCGLIDMRHFFQLLYISHFAEGMLVRNPNRAATRKGREHELEAESKSRFAAEDTPSNALGAFSAVGLAGLPSPDSVFDSIKATLTLCDPVDFASLSAPSQNAIVKFYGDLIPDPAAKAPGGKIPKAQNETALPAVLEIKECGGKDRSFPFGLDSEDSDRKTISDRRFAGGAAAMASGGEIRDFVSAQRPEVIRGLATEEKIRMLKVLLSGDVSQEDRDAADTIEKNSSPDELERELDAISPVVRPLPAARLHVDVPPLNYDNVLLPLLERRFRRTDVGGYGDRLARLKEFFGRMEREDAQRLYVRLKARRPGDKVSERFYGNLSREARHELLRILERRSS
jgi:hypothetical protein